MGKLLVHFVLEFRNISCIAIAGHGFFSAINDIESKLTFVYLIIAKKYFMPFFIEIGTFKFIDEIFIQTRIEIYLVEIKFQVKCYVML